MGTRSTTKFIETWTENEGKQKKQTLMCMYRQFDGYPDSHGQELADFLKEGKLVNGLGGDDGRVFNGMGCLAAQVVAHFKTGPGGFYISSVKDRQQFNYEVIGDFNTRKLTLVCKNTSGRVLFKGDPKDFEAFAKKYHA